MCLEPEGALSLSKASTVAIPMTKKYFLVNLLNEAVIAAIANESEIKFKELHEINALCKHSAELATCVQILS